MPTNTLQPAPNDAVAATPAEPPQDFDPRQANPMLQPGALLVGTQSSDKGSAFEVTVKVLSSSLADGRISGRLTILGLTGEDTLISTLFDGEIVGPKHSFFTGGRFDTDSAIDRQHWTRFPTFAPYAATGLDVRPGAGDRVLFCRFKERFIIDDDWRQSSRPGLSYSGLYYVVLDLDDLSLSGLYFAQQSELWFQKLELRWTAAKAGSTVRVA